MIGGTNLLHFWKYIQTLQEGNIILPPFFWRPSGPKACSKFAKGSVHSDFLTTTQYINIIGINPIDLLISKQSL